jgi:hypothetical protein
MELRLLMGETEHEKQSPYPHNASANKLMEKLFDHLSENGMDDYKEVMVGCTVAHLFMLTKYMDGDKVNSEQVTDDIDASYEKIIKENIEYLPMAQVLIEEKPHKYLNIFLHTKQEKDFNTFFVLSKDETKPPLKVIVDHVDGMEQFWKGCDVDFEVPVN